MIDSGPPLRKDAARNRERLLDAARELFAREGLHVSLNDIAHHAGVGVGTAYRRFANKEEVIDALFEERICGLVDAASRAVAHEDAWEGLVSYLDEAMHLQFGDRGLNEMMNNPALGDERVAEVRDRVAPLLDRLASRAKAQGSLRPDIDQSDLVFIQVGLSAVMDASRTVEPDLYRRYLALFLDAIRAGRSEVGPLPVPALSADQTHRAMTRKRS